MGIFLAGLILAAGLWLIGSAMGWRQRRIDAESDRIRDALVLRQKAEIERRYQAKIRALNEGRWDDYMRLSDEDNRYFHPERY